MIEVNIGDGYSYNHNHLDHNSTMAEVMAEKGLCVLILFFFFFLTAEIMLYI